MNCCFRPIASPCSAHIQPSPPGTPPCLPRKQRRGHLPPRCRIGTHRGDHGGSTSSTTRATFGEGDRDTRALPVTLRSVRGEGGPPGLPSAWERRLSAPLVAEGCGDHVGQAPDQLAEEALGYPARVGGDFRGGGSGGLAEAFGGVAVNGKEAEGVGVG